jgi:hypothetical protein
VSVTFQTGDTAVCWVFARDLLISGLSAPTGEGDVMIWPSAGADGRTICLSLSTPEGHALFEAPRWILEEFLAQSLETVPAGAESDRIDLDRLIAQLLAD